MAEGGREGQELSRRIRDELERIRDAESRVEDALDSVRQARRRVEVIARDLGREEMRVRTMVREELMAASGLPAPAAPPLPVEGPAESEGARAWRTDSPAGWARRLPGAAELDPAADPGAAGLDPGAAAPPAPIRVNVPVLAPPRGATRNRDVPLPAARAQTASWADQRSLLVGIGAAALIAVMLIGWLAIRGLQRDPGTEPASVAEGGAPAPVAPLADAPPPEPSAPAPTSVLAALPADVVARTAVYDSLWTARSPLFDPLLATIERDSDDRAVKRAVAAWREGGVDVQESDLLHSAFVQAGLRLRTGRSFDIDGQLLRNPCRGTSCVALLELWRGQRERYGLPVPPSNAVTNTTALRQAEVALVLDWMKEAAGETAATP